MSILCVDVADDRLGPMQILLDLSTILNLLKPTKCFTDPDQANLNCSGLRKFYVDLVKY